MSIVIPDEVVQATQMTEREIQQEFALWLFSGEHLTLGQASAFAKVSISDFLDLLKERGIPPHYGVNELEEDVETLRRLGRIQ